MLFPSKATPYDASVLPKITIAIKCLSEKDYKPIDLFNEMRGQVIDIGDFLDVMDCLYLLGIIYINEENGVISYVDENNSTKNGC